MKVLFYFFFCLLVLALLVSIVSLASFSFMGSFEDKGGPFECGFQPFGGSGFLFSMPFFIISLMFLLFDVEILLICFYPLVYSFSFYTSFFMWFVLAFVLSATIYEWGKGVINWV